LQVAEKASEKVATPVDAVPLPQQPQALDLKPHKKKS
jgi:hypothetical protein